MQSYDLIASKHPDFDVRSRQLRDGLWYSVLQLVFDGSGSKQLHLAFHFLVELEQPSVFVGYVELCLLLTLLQIIAYDHLKSLEGMHGPGSH